MTRKVKYIFKKLTSEEIAEIKNIVHCGCEGYDNGCEGCVFQNFPCEEILETCRSGKLEKGVTMKISEMENKVVFIKKGEK